MFTFQRLLKYQCGLFVLVRAFWLCKGFGKASDRSNTCHKGVHRSSKVISWMRSKFTLKFSLQDDPIKLWSILFMMQKAHHSFMNLPWWLNVLILAFCYRQYKPNGAKDQHLIKGKLGYLRHYFESYMQKVYPLFDWDIVWPFDCKLFQCQCSIKFVKYYF